jgi:hypothetical protein
VGSYFLLSCYPIILLSYSSYPIVLIVPITIYLGRQFYRFLRVIRDGVGAGVEGADEGPRRVQPEEVEVMLKHPVHQERVFSLS